MQETHRSWHVGKFLVRDGSKMLMKGMALESSRRRPNIAKESNTPNSDFYPTVVLQSKIFGSGPLLLAGAIVLQAFC